MAILYKANDNYSATLTAGYTVGQNTLSVTSVPPNLPTIVTVGYNTDKETHFIVTGSSGGNTLTGVSRLKGANTNLDNLTPVTCLNLEEFQNQYLTMISSADTLAAAIFGVDGGSTDDYVVALSPAPASLSAGLMIVVRFNTSNTGPATINVNGLGAKAIKKYGNQDLATGDIIAGQISILIYDGTNFQLISHNITELSKPLVKASYQNVTTISSASGATVLDCSTSNIFLITMSADATFSLSNVSIGQVIFLIFTNATAHTPTLPSSIKWNDSTPPTFVGNYNAISLFCYDTGAYIGSEILNNG